MTQDAASRDDLAFVTWLHSGDETTPELNDPTLADIAHKIAPLHGQARVKALNEELDRLDGKGSEIRSRLQAAIAEWDRPDPANNRPPAMLTALPESPRLDWSGTSGTFHCTDLGNARRLVARHGRDLHYCHAWSRWLIWDGRRWIIDETGEVYRRAKDTVQQIYAEAACADDETRKAIARWAIHSENNTRIKAMVELAQSEPGIPVTPGDLDADPWLLNVQNGTLDLRSGTLRAHNRGDRITRLAPVSFDAGATCPTFDAFLNRIMADNKSVISFLQRAIGYSLTGDTSERALFVLYGTGANGKSTLLETIRAMTGDYALRTPTRTLMVKSGDSVPNDVARLKGARFVSASESEEGQRLAEAQIKDLTGDDTISARFMRAEWFEFRPECKIWLATNHKPEIRGTEKAIWDRIKLIPFTITIPDQEQDKQLTGKLQGELDGILAWAVRGCLAWQHAGLGIPQEVKDATEMYRNEQNMIGGFIDDCCVIHVNARVTVGKLYDAYKSWAEQNGEFVLTKRKMNERLVDRGLTKEPGTNNVLTWRGIGLAED